MPFDPETVKTIARAGGFHEAGTEIRLSFLAGLSLSSAHSKAAARRSEPEIQIEESWPLGPFDTSGPASENRSCF